MSTVDSEDSANDAFYDQFEDTGPGGRSTVIDTVGGDDAADDHVADDHLATEAFAEDDFVPRAPRRLAWQTLALLGCVIVGIGFISGVLTQKHHDSGLTRSGTGTGAAARGAAFSGAGAFGAGGFAGTRAGAGTGSTGSAADTTTQAVPVVIGKVTTLAGGTAKVTNLGGTAMTVHLSKATKITAPFGSTALASGTSVAVYGSKGSDGSITATSITVQQ